MKVKLSSRVIMLLAGLLLCSNAVVMQTSAQSIQLIPAVNVRNSTTQSYANLVTFSTSTVYLSCPATGITATLSGPAMDQEATAPAKDTSGNLLPGGNLLVDNALLITVTPQGGSPGTPINACANAVGANQSFYFNGPIPQSPTDLTWSCFNTNGYNGGIAGTLALSNANPDTTIVPGGTQIVDYVGGVQPIDIASSLVSGQQSLQLSLVDGGGVLASSSIFLTTNCTITGVGAGDLGGNPINPDGSGKTQTFNFNSLNGQIVGFAYDVSGVIDFQTDGGPNGSIPRTTDSPIDPTTFQPNWVAETPFATSSCFIHNGEVLPDGVTKACKLYSLACIAPDGSTTVGANCPKSKAANEKVVDHFDGPALFPSSLPNIYNSAGKLVAHTGIGFIMASENWAPALPNPAGQCTFESASGLGSVPCPQNLLTDFSGPGAFASTGDTENPNSTFISIYGVPQPLTKVNLQGAKAGNWVNVSQPQIGFLATPPNFTNGAFIAPSVPLPGAANFIPAPIQSITFGISTVDQLPLPINEPTLTTDTVLKNTTCPQSYVSSTEPSFGPPKQTLNSLPDGQYLLHYYAEDCSGTQELKFVTTGVSQNNEPIWATKFYTIPVNIDTTPPVVTIQPLASTYVKLNSTVYAQFYCTDASTGSGVTHCGSNSFATQSTYITEILQMKINTSSLGQKTLIITGSDGAGNNASSVPVIYTVIK